jgi:hypothetical protein
MAGDENDASKEEEKVPEMSQPDRPYRWAPPWHKSIKLGHSHKLV